MFVDRVVIGTFVIICTFIALAEFDVLPLWVWYISVPAYIATFFVEIMLHRYFFINLGLVRWAVLAVFVFLQSVAIGLLYRLMQDISLWRP